MFQDVQELKLKLEDDEDIDDDARSTTSSSTSSSLSDAEVNWRDMDDADWSISLVDEWTYTPVRDAMQERWIRYAQGEAPRSDDKDKVFVFGPEGETGERSQVIFEGRRCGRRRGARAKKSGRRRVEAQPPVSRPGNGWLCFTSRVLRDQMKLTLEIPDEDIQGLLHQLETFMKINPSSSLLHIHKALLFSSSLNASGPDRCRPPSPPPLVSPQLLPAKGRDQAVIKIYMKVSPCYST